MCIFIILDDDKESVVGSDGSDSEEDFVVIIPDCFNLELPLSTHPHDFMTRSCDYLDCMTSSHDNINDVMVQSHDSIMSPTPIVSNLVPIPPQVTIPDTTTTTNKPEHQTLPTNNPKTTAAHKIPSTSPRTGRRPFVPERVTLRGVKDSRIRNPLTVATGIVNTVSDLVEGLTLPGRKRGTTEKDAGKQDTTASKEEATVINDNQEQPQNSPEEDEEMFVVSESHLYFFVLLLPHLLSNGSLYT